MTKGFSAFLITATIILFLTLYFRKPVFLVLFGQIIVFSLLIDFWDLVVLGNYQPDRNRGALALCRLGAVDAARLRVSDSLDVSRGRLRRTDVLYREGHRFSPLHRAHRQRNGNRRASRYCLALSSKNGLGAVAWGTFVYAATLGTLIKIVYSMV
ncbi:MAG: hypothetical protein MZU97_25240 [Bacillus subtilis]|nr:hypothetical protein [Bacillus subtilis]